MKTYIKHISECGLFPHVTCFVLAGIRLVRLVIGFQKAVIHKWLARSCAFWWILALIPYRGKCMNSHQDPDWSWLIAYPFLDEAINFRLRWLFVVSLATDTLSWLLFLSELNNESHTVVTIHRKRFVIQTTCPLFEQLKMVSAIIGHGKAKGVRVIYRKLPSHCW